MDKETVFGIILILINYYLLYRISYDTSSRKTMKYELD